ncbi:hypothetical protein AADR41_26990 [Streptomyces sp. CLV115]|uniref:hypothetical protein n=1 Tax=Streptomyces sp. CLV115 TaxID=3138502 RepID=UPI00313E4FAA
MVPETEQDKQGGRITGFHKRERLVNKDGFWVAVCPAGNGLVCTNAESTYATVLTGTSYGHVDVAFDVTVGGPLERGRLGRSRWISLYFPTEGPLVGDPLSEDLAEVLLLGDEEEYQWWRRRGVHSNKCRRGRPRRNAPRARRGDVHCPVHTELHARTPESSAHVRRILARGISVQRRIRAAPT